MPRFLEIISKAYAYTKSHNYLWFFGIFLTFCGVLNFLRFMDWEGMSSLNFYSFLFFAFGGLLLSVVVVFLASVARAVIIHTVLHLERREDVQLKITWKQTQKSYFKVFLSSLFLFAVLLFIFTWLFLPVYYFYQSQELFKPLLITLVGLAIFLPIFVSLILVNFFSACFIVIYNLPVWRALQSSFDLFMRYWERMFGLFVFITVLYLVLFSFSASLIGLFLVFAYKSQFLLQSLSLLLLFVVTLILILTNALLNVFTNIAWTLFFLKIVKAKRFPELEKAAAVEPAL
jgi:hypothetical protein